MHLSFITKEENCREGNDQKNLLELVAENVLLYRKVGLHKLLF